MIKTVNLFRFLILFGLSICVVNFANAQCTNCTTTTSGNDTILTFTSGTGSFTPPNGVTSVDYLVVGGGGGGGNGDTTSFFFTLYEHGGGGGGAGGVLSGTFAVSATTYTINVGAGGTGGVGNSGTNGGDSSFDSFTAIGGGGGGQSTIDGNDGASGGGGGSQGTGGNGSQGNNGGDGHATLFNFRGGGGGGGSSSVGTNGGNSSGGNGGAGISSTISGSNLTYGQGGNGGDPANTNGQVGASNTGNGGAGGWTTNGSGGNGGSGVVIIRYETPAALIAEFQFDEDVWTGASQEVFDNSGNSMHGTAIGGATTSSIDPVVAGNPGTCRYGVFDGNNDYVDAGNISATLNATASLAFWIKTTQTGNDTGWLAPGVAGVEQAGGDDDIFWGWIDGSGRIGISVGNAYSTKSTVAVNNNVWRHVVLTRDHVAGTYKIYIDGVLNISGAIQTGVIGNTYSSIGRIEDTGGSPAYFAGDLDEVRIYSSVLSDAEVSTVMAETHPCTQSLCYGENPRGGLIGDYYNGISLSGGIVNSRVDGPVDFNWGANSPGVTGIGANQFSVQWNGYIRVTESGQYFFRTISDDGVRLRLDDVTIISNWGDHGATADTSAGVNLIAGQVYPIVLEFYENGGLAEIRLQWQTPSSGSFSAIPAGPSVLGNGLYSCQLDVVSYYEISHSGNGVTCEAEPITITAYDSTNNPVNPPNGTAITFGTNPASGVWPNGNSFTFTGSDNSTVQYLQQTSADTLNIDVTDGSASESASADPNIIFTDAGIRFYGDTSNSTLPNQIAGITDANTVLRIVETNSDTGACVARLQNTSRDVDLAYECRNPGVCSSGQALTLNGTAIQNNNSGAGISFSTVNLSFDANGYAGIPFNFTDAGQIRLHAELDLPAENDDPAITLTGTSSEFVVKPDQLIVTTVESSGGDANPQTQQSGAGFVAAGEVFTVAMQALNANGDVTPAFGRETMPEGVEVSINALVFPAGGSSGFLTNADSFVALGGATGSYENQNLSWSEVGSLTLLPQLSDNDYLGAGDVTGTASNTIGRFYPANFILQSSGVTNSCSAGSFSYLSEPNIDVAYQIAAVNQSGAVTTNYDNTDLNYSAASVSVHGEDSNDGIDLASRISVANESWNDGVLSLNDNSAFVARRVDGSLNIVPDGPLSNVSLGLQINDIDSVDFSSLDFKPSDSNDCVGDGDCDSLLLSGSLNLLFGRLHLADGHGPESSPIPMVWQTEFWNGSGFEINSGDQCTQFPLSAISFVGATTSVDDSNDNITVDIGGISSVFNFSDPSGSDDCLTTTNLGFCDGRAGVFYGAPGSIVTYPIDINLSSTPFLQGDWNQDGNYNDNNYPTTYIRFQHYRGHDRVIFWRERLQ